MVNTMEIRVWDPLVRGFHWMLVTAFVIAFITEDDLLTLHTWAGYTVLALVAFRWIWGLVLTIAHTRHRPPYGPHGRAV